MRIEHIHYFVPGAMLALAVWVGVRAISSRPARFHLRVAFLAMGLGFIVVPGHGEVVAAPILATVAPPLRPRLLMLGAGFFLFWWAATLAVVKVFGRGAR